MNTLKAGLKFFTPKSFQRKENNPDNDVCLINQLPNEILSLIFLHLEGTYLCKNVIRTCKLWQEILDSESFWTEKLLFDSRINVDLIKYLSENQVYEPKRLYFKNPYTKNLIKNPCAEQGYDFWITKVIDTFHFFDSRKKEVFLNYKNEFHKNTTNLKEHDGFRIETDEHGAGLLHDEKKRNLKKFVTTYYKRGKYQIIDLKEEGVDKTVLEKLKPVIEVSDSYTSRFDCGCEYNVRVGLYDADLNLVDSVSFDDILPEGSDWMHWRHSFKNYPNNLRYILFYHGGKDTKFWAGYYGVKLTNSKVKFVI